MDGRKAVRRSGKSRGSSQLDAVAWDLTDLLNGAAAQDITQLIVLRLVQGAAAGGLMTMAMATVGDLVAGDVGVLSAR